jgi:hypothetical protein
MKLNMTPIKIKKVPCRVLVLDKKTGRYKCTCLSKAMAKALNILFEDPLILYRFNQLMEK